MGQFRPQDVESTHHQQKASAPVYKHASSVCSGEARRSWNASTLSTSEKSDLVVLPTPFPNDKMDPRQDTNSDSTSTLEMHQIIVHSRNPPQLCRGCPCTPTRTVKVPAVSRHSVGLCRGVTTCHPSQRKNKRKEHLNRRNKNSWRKLLQKQDCPERSELRQSFSMKPGETLSRRRHCAVFQRIYPTNNIPLIHDSTTKNLGDTLDVLVSKDQSLICKDSDITASLAIKTAWVRVSRGVFATWHVKQDFSPETKRMGCPNQAKP